ncbi:unnamed protein product [Prorocentrum cordatum]|uniref:Uncharacterized protein n=1 Tax=Prorocentrum cordatum TaxID=2364126 RepID=A0ABN9VDR8_9DINO|nr:unnamed protein product [Polarella glacialis]
MDILEDFGLAALNTFGKKGRRNGTWRSPAGAWTTIDYVLVRRQGGYGHDSRPRFDLPVNLGGYRDHRPLQTKLFIGARLKSSVPSARPRWRRELLIQDLRAVQLAEEDFEHSHPIPDRVHLFRTKVQEGIEAMSLQEDWSDVCGSGKRFADPSEYFNAMEGVIIEAASQDYIDLPQPRGATTGPVFSEATNPEAALKFDGIDKRYRQYLVHPLWRRRRRFLGA